MQLLKEDKIIMIILGEKFKRIRKELGLSQKELSENICTQVTISKIETHNSIPTILILSKLCTRLGIQIEDICIYENDSSDAYEIFKEVELLCIQFNHIKAYRTLIAQVNPEQLSPLDLKQYYYYVGLTKLLGFNDKDEALSNLNIALLIDQYNPNSFIDILILHAIGLVYFTNKETGKGIVYIKKSLEKLNGLETIPSRHWEQLIKLYYNSAKFYSVLKDYQKAIELCSIGIKLHEEKNSIYYLDLLTYEKGFNLLKARKKKEAEKHYIMATGLGLIKKNKLLLKTIKKDCIEFHMTLNYFDFS